MTRRIKDFLGALSRVPKYVAGLVISFLRIRFDVLIGLGSVVLVYLIAIGRNIEYYLETPEQRQAVIQESERAAHSQREAAQQHRAQQARVGQLCHLYYVCGGLPKARRDCATSGNFDNCVNIKMEGEDNLWMTECTADGNVVSPPNDMPKRTDCIGPILKEIFKLN